MKKILLSFLAVILIFEEWLWDILTALSHSLVKWLHLQSLEQWLMQTSPSVALVSFSIPLLIVMPLNFFALSLLANGLILQGVLLELLAKLLGTLLVSRVFALTKPQLLSFAVIRIVYTTITSWLHWAHQRIIDTAIYRWSKQFKAEAKARFAAWFQ